ncbi:MAG TPA: hypothetical protein VGS97_09545 [Actinocrinis sp.]|nr:hypothetical protein [Actinocrinis sp.]
MQEPYVEAWINEGQAGTVLEVIDYVEYAEARPMRVGSQPEVKMRGEGHEKRRYIRLLVRFDLGVTIMIDADRVHQFGGALRSGVS